MSSDSDDIDEDELLQIALREQAQRDLSYNKGHTSRPVANFVQPPPSPLPQFSKEKKQQHQLQKNAVPSAAAQKNPSSMSSHRGRVAEDFRDSEVELLSISSGDEGSSSKEQGVAGKSRVGRMGREEESCDEGSEPNCWKRVDEDELHRNVRLLREARAVKPSALLSKKGANSMLSSPRGMEFVDPLGLGLIDIKSLRLITDGYESSSSRSERDYPDSSLRQKLMYFSEGFDAKLFLSRLHQDTSAADLEAGAVALKSDLQGRTRQKKQLVKENFDCFVSCKTTIDDIESKLRRIEEDPEGAGTSHLYNSIQGVCSLANRAFQPLFERQAQAEKIRSVQGMLQRFRTLFNLPSTIRENISKGEYDLAVREYRKAKSIVLPSHVGILKRVQEEVEKVMHEFKGMLYKSMENPQIDLATLENTVRLLLELDPDSDPVWYYLKLQNQRIPGLLEKCTYDHEMQMEMLHSEMRERVMSDARWQQLLQDLNLSSDAFHSDSLQNDKLVVDSEHIELSGEEVDALRGRYIRRLTAVVTHHLPNFWKVALSVFSGKFTKSASAESNTNTTAVKSEEKLVEGSYSSHSLDEVAGMIRFTISAYETKVQNTFRDLEECNILRPYMSDAIREISNACHAFESKESTPHVAVTALRALHLEISKIYVHRLCSWMRASLEGVSKEESWIPVSTLERNKSLYTISVLPLEFRSVIVAAMDQVSLVIRPLRSEVVKSEDMLGVFQELQESVRLSFLNCFLDFAGHMECLGSELAQRGSGKVSMQLLNGFSNNSKASLPGSVVDSDRQLLIVLSNIGYCKDELCGELYSKYRHVWMQSRVKDEEEDSDLRDLVMSFSGLEEKVLDHYTFMKSNLIRTAAVSYLVDSGFQWGGGAPAVKGIRDAAVELLHSLVSVHAEVFAGAKPLLDRTLGILVEALVDTFLSLFNENRNKELNSLDPNGFCQIMLELDYFETILNPYFTPDARESLKSLQGVLLEKATENVLECGENPGHQRRATRGSEDNLSDQQGMCVSPDDLIALAQQYSSELLQAELERTRVNTACFVESIVLDSVVPEPAKAAYSSFRSSIASPTKSHRSGGGGAHRRR